MNITLQIKTLIFSFLFGFFFSLVISFFYRLLYSNKRFIQIITSLFLVISAVFIYFFILKKINNAVFHIYEILSIILGYSLDSLLIRKIAKRNKR